MLLGLRAGDDVHPPATLPTDLSDDPREVGGASALMLLVGYLLAALAPSVLGAVRDATGEFGPAIWLLAGIAARDDPAVVEPHAAAPHGHAET